MRFIIFFFFVLFGATNAFADTTDIYHVYFHGRQIANFKEGQVIRIVLKSDSVRISDSIRVDVHSGHACGNSCTYSMLIFGNKGPMYIDSLQHTEDFYIPLRPLMQHKFQTGTNEFTGYYTEFPDTGTRSRVITFKIILQGL